MTTIQPGAPSDNTQGPQEYTLVYTTVQGTIEEAQVTADLFDDEGPYLRFGHKGRLVTAIPHASVVQFGQTDVATKYFKAENPDDSGSYLMFTDESRDPWAELSGKE